MSEEASVGKSMLELEEMHNLSLKKATTSDKKDASSNDPPVSFVRRGILHHHHHHHRFSYCFPLTFLSLDGRNQRKRWTKIRSDAGIP